MDLQEFGRRQDPNIRQALPQSPGGTVVAVGERQQVVIRANDVRSLRGRLPIRAAFRLGDLAQNRISPE